MSASKIISWSQLTTTIASAAVFEPSQRIISMLGSEWPEVEDLNRISHQLHPWLGLKFVPQGGSIRSRKKGENSLLGYIDRIVQKCEVQTRPQSTHDLFNFISFMLFPRTKMTLMKLHYQESLATRHEEKKGGRGRTRNQDLLTLFDEGGLIVDPTQDDHVLVFGHGVLEQYVTKSQKIRGFAWLQSPRGFATAEDLEIVDTALAEAVQDLAQFEDTSRFAGVYVPDHLIPIH